MNKLEKMSISDIIEQTRLCLSPNSLCEIWKPDSIAHEMLLNNDNMADQLINNKYQLYSFILEHENEIDKIKLLVILLKNYKETLDIPEHCQAIDPKELQKIQEGLEATKKLLAGINATYVFYNIDDKTNKITSLLIMNTLEEIQGKKRRDKDSNRKRLEELGKDIGLADVAQGILPRDFEYSIAIDERIGAEMRYMAEYNTLINEYGSNFPDKEEELANMASNTDRVKFIGETLITLWIHIEEVNMDKMLLCSAYRYIEGVENREIKKDEIGELKRRLEVIRKHIKKNVTVTIFPDILYSLRDFERDLKRFVGKGENVKFLYQEDIKQLKDALVSGEITLTSLGRQNYEAISLEPAILSSILRKNPNNYIFFLRQEKCEYSKTVILGDIRKTNICSSDLLQLLCEKTDITAEEILDLFDTEIISANDLAKIRGQTGPIIQDETLFEKYKQYKNSKDDEKERAKTVLERYALAYRNTELIGKSAEEIQEKGEEFITNVGEEIEPSDLVQLYGLDIIPLKIAVDWGGENIIEELLESESLKPTDARHLRDDGLLDENVLERLFQKCTQMSYSYQVSLVFAVFDGQTPEEQEIREKLAQYYHIENGTFKTTTKSSGRKKGSRISQKGTQEQKVKMRDPGAKYNLLASIDKDVKIEEGITDGHIIFHYPNIDGGTVLIEKLHKIRTNKENGVIEIKADNESATYVLSEEEFIKLKTQLIKDGKVDRTELTQRWWVTKDPEHWIAHAGTSAWERAIMQRFNVKEENSRYSPEDLAKIEQLVAKSIESKKLEER